jgi:hypothetical protein
MGVIPDHKCIFDLRTLFESRMAHESQRDGVRAEKDVSKSLLRYISRMLKPTNGTK